jgi:hypothetical protein
VNKNILYELYIMKKLNMILLLVFIIVFGIGLGMLFKFEEGFSEMATYIPAPLNVNKKFGNMGYPGIGYLGVANKP